MNRYGLKVVVLHTDRRRAYITDDDMNTLVDHIYQQVIKTNNKTQSAIKNNELNKGVITTPEGKYYSLASVASLLGVSVVSIKKWSKQHHIQKKLIMSDKKRTYLSRDDVLRIAELHGCRVSPNVYSDTDIQREYNIPQYDMDQLYSIKNAALLLDVTPAIVRKWIRQDNIDKKRKFGDRGPISITYRDVLRLAELHGCEIVPNPPSLTIKEEIQQIKGRLERLESVIEDIKHDFKLFVKRSIYIP